MLWIQVYYNLISFATSSVKQLIDIHIHGIPTTNKLITTTSLTYKPLEQCII